MDQYLFNYMCLNYYLKLTKTSKTQIKAYFKEIQRINWCFVDKNRAFFNIDATLKLPVSGYFMDIKTKVDQFYSEMLQCETAYITPRDLHYPNRFKMFEPLSELLFYKGDRRLFNAEKSVAVVGARTPSVYGQKVAYELGQFLGEQGINVVSGMALGIDGIVHEGALSVGGKTTAVLASGVNRPYPSQHKNIYASILQNGGLIVSENKLNEVPMKYHFPLRNRMISGLADVVIVVEASMRSGSLITARYGLDQGKVLFAVPGNIYHKNAEGTNQLIYDGAIPLLNFEDVLSSMNWESEKKIQNAENLELSENSKSIYELLKKRGTLKISDLQRYFKLDIGTTNSLIMELIMAECCEYVSIDEIQIK